jgi:hypothetical protein
MGGEIPDGGPPDQNPFGPQQSALELEVAAVSTELARGGDDPMAGNVALPAVAHDIANRTRRSGPSSRLGHVAVGGNLADGDFPNDTQDPIAEFGHKRQLPAARCQLPAVASSQFPAVPEPASREPRAANREP